VVLISIDTCRADVLGCYGAVPSATPNLDRLAAEGTVFLNAISPVPITLPAHASLMTGLTPRRHGVHSNLGHLVHPDLATLAEELAARGFSTAGFVSSIVLDQRFGLDQGFTVYDDRLADRPHGVFGAERPGRETVALALRWLRAHRGERFFLFVHLYEPHEPYEPPPELAELFPGSPYLGEVAEADACVGRVLEGLAELDLDGSTLVVVVGDHGEMLGEHGEDAHTYFVYQSALEVPFIVRLPRDRTGARVERLVGLVDVAPTVCGLLVLPPPAGIDGADLSPLILGRGEAIPPVPVLCESLTPTRYGANPLLGLVGERWKVIDTTRPELYDLVRDPGETDDLASSHPAILSEQLRLMGDRLAAVEAPAAAASAPAIDDQTARRLEALGYSRSPVHPGLGIDPSRPDPKDLIAVHVAHTRALQLIAAGDFRSAEPLSRRVLEALPDSWEAHLTLGNVAVGLGRWPEAAALFERSLELRPAHHEALMGLGQACAGGGDCDRAAAAFRRALALEPGSFAAALRLARALFDCGRDADGELALSQATRLARGRPTALRDIAVVLDEVGHGVQATALRREALGLASAQGRDELRTALERELQGR
jgi:tetratricopeptide (TPR) repeat protein